MTHPLHEPHKIVEASYVFGITVEVNDEYWEIHLKESEETRNFSKRHLWPSENNTLYAELSTNNRYVNITFPNGAVRTIQTSEEKLPERTQDSKVQRIKEDKEQSKKRKTFHKLLEERGIRFNIDFNTYKEDADYMTVYINGKEVFSGITEDLKTPKPKKEN